MSENSLINEKIISAINRFIDDMPILSKTNIRNLLSSGEFLGVTEQQIYEALRELDAEGLAHFIGDDDVFVTAHENYAKLVLSDYVLKDVIAKIRGAVEKRSSNPVSAEA